MKLILTSIVFMIDFHRLDSRTPGSKEVKVSISILCVLSNLNIYSSFIKCSILLFYFQSFKAAVYELNYLKIFARTPMLKVYITLNCGCLNAKSAKERNFESSILSLTIKGMIQMRLFRPAMLECKLV